MLHKDAQDQLEIGDQVKLFALSKFSKYKSGIWIFDGYSRCNHVCNCKGYMHFKNNDGESFFDCLNFKEEEYIPIEYIIKKLDDNLFEI